MSPDIAAAPGRATIQQIVASGFSAPSGDNLQPWIVDWRDGVLSISVDRHRERSLYNFRYRASLIALGAMLENVVIATRQHGLDCDLALNADGDDLLSATVKFRRAAVTPDPLYEYI